MSGSSCLVFILLIAACKVVSSAEWDYDEEGPYGPSKWADNFGDYCGLETAQSPIDIVHDDAVVSNLDAITFHGYDETPIMKLTNNGHTVVLTVDDPDFDGGISDGSLGAEYKFAQLHFHWGTSICSGGSEHTFDGIRYPMEMHLVHYNRKYGSLTEAVDANEEGGLAVLGVMYNVIDKWPQSLTYKTLGNMVRKVWLYESVTRTRQWMTYISLRSLLPLNLGSFYRYKGSLTTPTCNEIVEWTVFKEPVDIDYETFRYFGRIYDSHRNRLVEKYGNYRPLQALGDRTVKYRDGTCT